MGGDRDGGGSRHGGLMSPVDAPVDHTMTDASGSIRIGFGEHWFSDVIRFVGALCLLLLLRWLVLLRA